MTWEYDAPVKPAIDHDGREVVLVPVRDADKPAKLLSEDWNRLADMGVSPHWYCSGPARRYVYCGSRKNADKAIVARLVMDCNATSRVQYFDGDRLNLRRDNLWLRHATLSVSGLEPARTIFEDTSAALLKIWQRRVARRGTK